MLQHGNFLFDDGDSGPGRRPHTPRGTRRSHSKTRSGCKKCKERRIKCDENRPTCDNCVRAKCVKDCMYEKIAGEIPGKAVRVRRRRKSPENEGGNTLSFVSISSEDVARHGTQMLQGSYGTMRLRQTQHEPVTTREPPSEWQGYELGSHEDYNAEDLANETLAALYNDPSLDLTAIGSHWQVAPSTAFSVSAQGERIAMSERELHCFFLSTTYPTIPFAPLSAAIWRNLTFATGRENPFYYHITLAIAAAHQRYLHVLSGPAPQETNHVVKALSSFRQALSVSDAPGLSIASTTDICAVLATTTLLILHTWSAPIEDLDSAIYTNTTILTGSRDLVRAFMPYPQFADILRGVVILEPDYDEVYARYNIGEYRFRALEMMLPGCNIYSRDSWEFVHDTLPADSEQIVDQLSLHRLAIVMTIMSSPRRMTRPVFSILVKTVFNWVAGCDQVFLRRLREKNLLAYVLVAHYFAIWWRMRYLATTFKDQPAYDEDNEFGIGEDLGLTWWMEETPRAICKGVIRKLGPEWSGWLVWVEETIEAFDED